MTQIVTAIEPGWTNTGRFPYALARLSCGHVARVVLRPTRGRCTTCGVERDMPQTGPYAECCGRSVFGNISMPNAHVEADRLTKVGDCVACDDCQKEADQIEWLKALDSSLVHHTRERWGGIHLYRLAPESPSNFLLIGSVAPTAAASAIIRSWGSGKTPLSPTEAA